MMARAQTMLCCGLIVSHVFLLGHGELVLEDGDDAVHTSADFSEGANTNLMQISQNMSRHEILKERVAPNMSSKSGPPKPPAHSVFSVISTQIEYELNRNATEVPLKSKIALAIINGFGLGMCGIDRCFMGQTCCGIIKALTLGGFSIWFLIDYVIIKIDCLQKAESIDTLGFKAKFSVDEIGTAFLISLILWWIVCPMIAFKGLRFLVCAK